MAAQGLGNLIGSGASFQGQVDDLKIHLVELMEEVKVKGPFARKGVVLPELLRNGGASADIDLEAADGPQQELYHSFHVPVVGLGHFRRAVDTCSADRDPALIPFHGNGDRLLRALQIGVHPDTEGDKAGIQLGNVLHGEVNT